MRRSWWLAPALGIAVAASGPAAAEPDGKALFEKNCMKCHGAALDGDTPAGKKMKVPSLKDDQLVADQVVKTVRENNKHKPVSKKVPSDADLQAIAAYVVTLGASP